MRSVSRLTHHTGRRSISSFPDIFQLLSSALHLKASECSPDVGSPIAVSPDRCVPGSLCPRSLWMFTRISPRGVHWEGWQLPCPVSSPSFLSVVFCSGGVRFLKVQGFADGESTCTLHRLA
ncbi:hypothetical protein ACOMHN_053235 [Nucella lapillus]